MTGPRAHGLPVWTKKIWAGCKGLIVLLLVISLVGCATQMTVPASAQKLQGVFGVVHNHHAESGRFIWAQTSLQDYSVELYGPLGLGATELTATPSVVKLETARGKVYYAASAEALFDEVLGWSMPVSGMSSWLWGQPVPKVPFTAQYDYGQRITILNQDGWQMVYTWENGRIHKIVMTQGSVRVTVVINAS